MSISSKKKLSKKQLYSKIYHELIRGLGVTKIAKSIGYDKGYVSRIKDELVQAGFLVPINPRSRSVMYSATKKKFKGEVVNKISKLTGGKSQQYRHRLNVVKIQKATFITDVKSPPSKNVKWDNEFDLSSDVHVSDFVYPFANIGDVRFRRFEGKSSDRLMIYTPQMIWEVDSGDPEDYLEEVSRLAAGWIQKRFCMKLENLQKCQKPHYAKTLTDPRLIGAAQDGSYNINGLMVDASAPDKIPEIESEDWNLIEDLSNAPSDIRSLKSDVAELSSMMKVLMSQNKELMGTMKEFLSIPQRPDEFREVA